MPKKTTKRKAKRAAPKPKKAKKISRKPAPKKTKKPQRKTAKSSAVKTGGLSPEKQVKGGIFLGFVEDYFSHVNVVALTLKKPLAVGNTIRIKGHTTDITQIVESMQVEHAPIQSASAGDSIGIKIGNRARKGDAVYKI